LNAIFTAYREFIRNQIEFNGTAGGHRATSASGGTNAQMGAVFLGYFNHCRIIRLHRI
jgi:hypothetical protein